jgi:hypothetical protein
MNPDTGEIYQLFPGQTPHPGHIELTGREAQYLKGRKAKDRLTALKRLRKQAVKAAKRAVGGRLHSEEMQMIYRQLRG